MNSVNTPPSGPAEPERHPVQGRSLKKIAQTLWAELSEADRKNGGALTSELIFDTHLPHGSWVYKRRMEEVFASPLYSDECKRYVAVQCLYRNASLILLVADQFVTEEIIVASINKLGQQLNRESYIKALMGSSHLSDRIVETILKEIDWASGNLILELSPKSIITPRLVSGCVSRAIASAWKVEDKLSAAALAIRRAHPEYEKFPDEWALKVFCGE